MTTATKETADTIMSAMGNEVDVNIHNPLLQERLQHPDAKANPNIPNGSVKKTSLCSGSTNGCGDNMNNSEDENTSQSPVNDLHSTVINMGQISREESDCVSLCSQKCSQSEKNIIMDCVDSEKPNAPKDENNVENLMCRLDTTLSDKSVVSEGDEVNGITYVVYESEKQMPDIMRLITKDLSEPYSIYTYRYFIHNWPKLCFLAMDGNTCIGAIVCKLDMHKKMVRRGYIAMLAVDSAYRRKKLGSTLVTKAIQAMIRDDCDEVVLETEITNQAALHLYENLGFVRDKRLFRYYLNGVDALRLKLWLR